MYIYVNIHKMVSERDRNLAYSILSEYKGENYFILTLRRNVYILKNVELNDLEIEYIIKNYDKKPISVNRMTKIAKWYGEKFKTKENLDFVPEKIKVITIAGETTLYYHALIQYQQSVLPKFVFLPKNAVLNNLFAEEFTDLKLDFTWFDKKLKQVDPDYFIYDHQKDAIKFMLTRKRCILSLDMGLGKTMSSIIASLMYGNKKVLVICPASIKSQWLEELSVFIDPENVNIIKGFNEMNKPELMEFLGITNKKLYKVDELRKMAKEKGKWNEGKQFTIVNFDILDEFHTVSRAKDNENSDLLKSDFDIVIIDEAHRLSRNSSSRFKIIKNYLKHAKNEYTWLLTGTMVTNDVKNLYNLLSLIETDITGDYKFFMEHYAGAKEILKKGEWDRCWNMWNNTRGYSSYSSLDEKGKEVFKKFVEKYGKHATVSNDNLNLDELNEAIKHLYFRRTKDSIMDVEKIIVPVTYNLTPEQRKEYNELWDKYEEEKRLEGKDLSEIKQLVSISVNRQYISKLMVPNTIKITENLLAHDKKVFIVCCYDEELYTLKNYFGDIAVTYNGKMDPKQKEKAKYEFNNNPNVKVLIGNITAVGIGLNLNKVCNHCIFQNMDFTDADFQQACDRIYRIGSKEDVYIYLQYYKNTVYEHIIDIITRKREISEELINDE